ncbi:MAG: acetyltransferase [Chloroflexota bacterium]
MSTNAEEIKRIVIIGTGGNCIDILDTLLDINRAQGKTVYECIGFLDDDPTKQGQSFFGVSVLGALRDAAMFRNCHFVFGIGSPSNFRRRREILERTGLRDECFETIIHPTASISSMARIGTGTVIFQNVTVTSNVVIGRHVYVLPNSVISHDVHIGDFTCIASAACISGNVQIGESCYIGANASIRENIRIGTLSMVGMGSVVIKNVPTHSTVLGNPARQKALPNGINHMSGG